MAPGYSYRLITPKRVSPLGTQHVSFYGKYIFEEESINTEDGLREINIAE